MYYADLTPYEYTRGYLNARRLNVGWLDAGQPFPTGAHSEAFAAALFQLCLSPIELKRGFHCCNLGCTGDLGRCARRGDVEGWLGNGEIEVWDGETGYRAPTLIYHYVTAYGYLPPPGFVAAVLRSAPIPAMPLTGGET